METLVRGQCVLTWRVLEKRTSLFRKAEDGFVQIFWKTLSYVSSTNTIVVQFAPQEALEQGSQESGYFITASWLPTVRGRVFGVELEAPSLLSHWPPLPCRQQAHHSPCPSPSYWLPS